MIKLHDCCSEGLTEGHKAQTWMRAACVSCCLRLSATLSVMPSAASCAPCFRRRARRSLAATVFGNSCGADRVVSVCLRQQACVACDIGS